MSASLSLQAVTQTRDSGRVYARLKESIDQPQLAGNRCAVVVISAFYNHPIFYFHHGTVTNLGLLSGWLEISETGAQDTSVNACIAKLNGCPFSTLANNYVFNLTKTVWESFPPSIIVFLVSLFACQFFLTSNIFKGAILRNNFCTAIRITHAPGFMKLANYFFCWMHQSRPLVSIYTVREV